jgi:histidinol-phosphatase
VNPDLVLALHLADIADGLTMRRFRAAGLGVEVKADGTPVTDADRDTEEAIRETLRRHRPDHAVVGEEHGAEGSSELRWFVDPVDGTRNFVRGVPVWATLIALRSGERPVCGVVSAPALGRRWSAARGEGARDARGAALRVSGVTSIEDAHLSCTDFRDFAALGHGAWFERLAARCGYVRGFGDFWSHMLVAEGALDVALEAVVDAWDVAAVQVIVEEAGGRFSDFAGDARIDSGTVVTSNGLLHDSVLGAIRDGT